MLSEIRTKIRALISDLSKSDIEVFSYSSGDQIFILAEENISSIIKVEKNGVELGSGTYSYDSTTNELTIISSLSSGDLITCKYNFQKYSDTELAEYIRASLVWLSIFANGETDYELEDDDIIPTMDNKTTDLTAIISSILIQPSYSEYRLPNLTVRYPRTMSKEDRIKTLIVRFRRGLGISDILEF